MNIYHLSASLAVPFGAFAMALLCGVLGYELLQILGMPGRSERNTDMRLTVPLISILFGSVIIGLVLYATALFDAMSKPVILTILTLQLVMAFLRHEYWATFVDLWGAWVFDLRPLSIWTKLLCILSLLVFVVFLFFGLCRAIVPTLEADSATFYLNAANLYLQYQSIINVGNVISSMGRTGFLQLVYGMGVFSSNLAQAYLFVLSATGFLLSALFIGRISGYAVAAFGLVVWVTSSYALHPIVLEAKFDGYTFALSSAVATLLYFVVKGEKKNWICTTLGLMAGFLGGITYNNLLVAGLAGLASMWLVHYEKKRKQLLSAILLAGIIGSAPTYIHNVAMFGNPVYPFAGKFFGSGHGTTIPEDSYNYYYMGTMKRDNVARSVRDVLELPLRLFVRDSDSLSFGQREWVAGMSTQRDPWLGGLLMIAMAGGGGFGLMWFIRRGGRSAFGQGPPELYAKLVFGGFGLAYLFWALNQYLFRYFSAGLPWAAIACGLTLTVLWQLIKPSFRNRLRHVSALVLLLLIGYMVWDWSDTVRMRLAPVVYWVMNGQTEAEYVAEHFSYCPDCRFGKAMIDLRSRLNDGDKVLSFCTGLYYLGSNVKAFSGNGSATVTSPLALRKPLSRFLNWSEWEQHIIEQKFRYLVINPMFLYLSDAEKPIIQGYLDNRTPDFTVGTTRIFKLY